MSQNQDYSVSFMVNNTPQDVFDAVNNVRGWWSQEIDGDTNRLGAEFKYHYQDVHRAEFRITELIPAQHVVWHAVDNYFNFISDPTEWVGTDIIFDIVPQGEQTELRFTHRGLQPADECYEVCSNAWGTYITKSLRDLITTGKGQPNPIEAIVDQARAMSQQNYTASFTVDQSPAAVFAAVNDVRGWWLEDAEGDTNRLGAVFTTDFGDIHHSTQQITEWVPDQKVVWHVTDSQLTFIENPSEWTHTDIVFEIIPNGEQTELRFTHVGLAPAIECYAACSDAWSGYIKHSLFNLITTGKGEPSRSIEITPSSER